jgi:hypothetical protein
LGNYIQKQNEILDYRDILRLYNYFIILSQSPRELPLDENLTAFGARSISTNVQKIQNFFAK